MGWAPSKGGCPPPPPLPMHPCPRAPFNNPAPLRQGIGWRSHPTPPAPWTPPPKKNNALPDPTAAPRPTHTSPEKKTSSKTLTNAAVIRNPPGLCGIVPTSSDVVVDTLQSLTVLGMLNPQNPCVPPDAPPGARVFMAPPRRPTPALRGACPARRPRGCWCVRCA